MLFDEPVDERMGSCIPTFAGKPSMVSLAAPTISTIQCTNIFPKCKLIRHLRRYATNVHLSAGLPHSDLVTLGCITFQGSSSAGSARKKVNVSFWSRALPGVLAQRPRSLVPSSL
jgi:hypothetical protein